ncbi:unnamed protein product [Nippostrongylus brasiliensis]|uniref:DUF1758 domain-containing protein n=1 Tax=Nippostrongylus brasiliensis TaxID=27835 RepID=A0A158QY33_NIPBR|nr:unnamed protein product [Nippostrongylus brasiliensis]
MASQLSSHKRLLTQHCNKLESILSRFKGEHLEEIRVEDDSTPGYERESRWKLQEGLGAIEACAAKIEKLWNDYARTIDEMDEIPSSEKGDFQLYSKKAEQAISSALDYTVILEGRSKAFASKISSSSHTDKYGNYEDIVNRLIDRLEKTVLRSPVIKDQRVLLEELQVIMSQLQQKGEQIDNQWLIKQVLSKFPDRVQRKVLERKNTMETRFSMENLLQTLEEIISNEEKIALFTTKKFSTSTRKDQKYDSGSVFKTAFNISCMYCKADHKAANCVKYKTPHERAKYLRDRKLCFICASPDHSTLECKKRPCFACQGRHHTSCCFKLGSTGSTFSKPTSVPESKRTIASPPTKDRSKETPRKSGSSTAVPSTQGKRTAAVHKVGHGNANQRPRVPEDLDQRESFLPTGELTVMDPTTRQLRKIPVLLDSGAEFSFIDTSLVEELRLPSLGSTKLRICTFGSNRVQECVSDKISLETWDDSGRPHSLKLFTYTGLTTTLKTPPLLEEDIAYINTLKIPFNLAKQSNPVKPQILLGSDQLWQLIKQDQTHIPLPSGLHLLPTHLGHMLTGQIQDPRTATPRERVLTDSEIVLNWISSQPRHDMGPFIRNRVSEIRNITQELQNQGFSVQFGHIASQMNPADCATRGLDKMQLADHFWWNGPHFLSKPKDQWRNAYDPITLEQDSSDELRDTNTTKVAYESSAQDNPGNERTKNQYVDLFKNIRSSNFSSVQRVVAYVIRFIKGVTARVNKKRTVPVTFNELLGKGTAASSTSLSAYYYQVTESIKTLTGRRWDLTLSRST